MNTRTTPVPHHGVEVVIQTKAGPVTLRTSKPGLCQRLAAAYDGDVQAAADACGVSRRRAAYFLERMGLHEPGGRYNEGCGRSYTTFTHPVTERSIRTLYPLGTVRRLVERYESPERPGTRDLEAEFGIPNYTIWNMMSRLGIARSAQKQHRITRLRKQGRFDSPEEMDREIERLWREGDTIEQIARTLQVQRSYVWRAKTRLKLRRQKRTVYKRRSEKVANSRWRSGRGGSAEARDARAREVQRLRADGVPALEIAERLECSACTVYSDLKRELDTPELGTQELGTRELANRTVDA